jgi:Helix-turn-helix
VLRRSVVRSPRGDDHARGPDGTPRRYSLPPPPPAELPLPDRERWALNVLSNVAAIQLTELPPRSLVRRLLEVPVSELDHWGSDPRFAGHSLGEGAPRRPTVEAKHGAAIRRLREAGLSQRAVAERIGCSQAAVSLIECRWLASANGAGR